MKFKQEKGYFYKKKSDSAKKYLLINPPIVDTEELFLHNRYDPGPIGLLRVANYLYTKNNYIRFFNFAYEKNLDKGVRWMFLPKRLKNDPYIPRGLYNWKNRIRWKKMKVGHFRWKQLFYFGKPFSTFIKEAKNIDPPDEILIGSCMTYSCGAFPKLLKLLKELFPKSKIVLGGFTATLLLDEMKKMGFDNVHVGSYKEADNFPPLYEIMDILPKKAVLRLTKGCPRNCSYCAVPAIEGRKITNFGFKQLREQFIHLYNLGFRVFIFWDANILYAKKELKMFFDYLVKNKYDVKIDLHYGLEYNLLDDDTLKLFDYEIMIRRVIVPLESSIKDIYEGRFHKCKNHLKNIDNSIKKLRRMRYKIGFFVLAGMPRQTLDDLLKTILYGHLRGCKSIIMPFSIIPKTEEYSRYKHLVEGKCLEETNPNLFPYASMDIRFKDLQDIIDIFHGTTLQKSSIGFYYLKDDWSYKRIPLLGFNNVMRRYIKLLKSMEKHIL
ncbi:MAG: radical SAM protein [Candidatus Thorarchaeota archaeon]